MNAGFVLLGGRIATMDAAGTEAQALAANISLGAWAQRQEPGKGSLDIG